MASFFRKWRLPAAALFAVALVGGAYVLAGNHIPSVPQAQAAAETALLQKIASQTGADGLPVWEDTLYGFDPSKAVNNTYGVSDSEAIKEGLLTPQTPSIATSTTPADLSSEVPVAAPAAGSLTDEFAKNFFTQYLTAQQASGNNLTDDQITALADQEVATLASGSTTTPDFKKMSDLHVSGTGPAALATYAADMENAASAASVNLPKSELEYLEDAVNGDSSAITNIQKIADAYHAMAAAFAGITVPQEVAPAHLEVVNAMERVGDIASDFAKFDTDPLTTLLAMQQYSQAVLDLQQGFVDLAAVFANTSFPTGSPAAAFLDGIRATTAASPASSP